MQDTERTTTTCHIRRAVAEMAIAKRHVGRSSKKWEVLNCIFRKQVTSVRSSPGSGNNPVVCCCEHGNELVSCLAGQVCDRQLVKSDIAAWS